MRKDQTEIIESTRTHRFRIRPGNITEYSFRERNGSISREAGAGSDYESNEFTGRGELTRLLPDKLKRTFFPPDNDGADMETVPLTRQGERISSVLGTIPGLEWEVLFNLLNRKKYAEKDRKSSGYSSFSHFSVLIRFRLREWNNFVEIGEGTIENKDHNISGLLSRVEDIIRCNARSGGRKMPEGLPLILSPGEGGIIFHEILGHSLEADHVFRGLSPFRISDVGRKVVSENITLSTYKKGDPFFNGVPVDDEGNTRDNNTLIEKGVLRHLISDSRHSGELGIEDLGSARMEDFTKRPLPRMFAIYLENGGSSHEELMGSTVSGVYAREFGDGKVLFHKNRFYFNIPSAYMIKNGRVTDPLGSITVSGKINEVFNAVEMVGDDFSFDRGISYCYKEGQTLNVRVGQPSVKINRLTFSRGMNDL